MINVVERFEENAVNLQGVDCTKINAVTKDIFNRINKGEIVSVFDPAGVKEAFKKSYDLMNLYFRLKISAEMTPLRQKLQRNSIYTHERIDIQWISIAPLVVNGTQFSTGKGTYTVVESQNRAIGNLSIPYYTIENIDTKEIIKNVSQKQLLNHTQINIHQSGIRKVASVLIGNGAFKSNWSVSLTKDGDRLYCSSPSHNGYKWERCIDVFGVDCMSFVESAVVRLVIAITGLSEFLDDGRGPNHSERSCENCKARRFVKLPDTVEGDAVNPDFGSKSTFDLRTMGFCDPQLYCAFTMEPIAKSEIKQINKDEIRGYTTSGHIAMNSEKFRMEAINCDKYHSDNYDFIRNNCHEVIYEKGIYLVQTAGIQLIFDTGIKDGYKPLAPRTEKKTEKNKENSKSADADIKVPQREKIAMVTGHRLGKKLGGEFKQDNQYIRAIESELEKEVCYLYSKGYRHFVTGMSHGVDLAYGKVILKLKEEYPDIKLECAIPCLEHTAKWNHMPDVLELYNKILSGADKITYVTRKTFNEDPSCMQRRNEYMVDISDYCTAVWDGSSGGTGNCVAYAQKKPGMQINIINPNVLMQRI